MSWDVKWPYQAYSHALDAVDERALSGGNCSTSGIIWVFSEGKAGLHGNFVRAACIPFASRPQFHQRTF